MCFAVLGIESRALHMPSQYSTTKLNFMLVKKRKENNRNLFSGTSGEQWSKITMSARPLSFQRL
jgi:hypothetical protein